MSRNQRRPGRFRKRAIEVLRDLMLRKKRRSRNADQFTDSHLGDRAAITQFTNSGVSFRVCDRVDKKGLEDKFVLQLYSQVTGQVANTEGEQAARQADGWQATHWQSWPGAPIRLTD